MAGAGVIIGADDPIAGCGLDIPPIAGVAIGAEEPIAGDPIVGAGVAIGAEEPIAGAPMAGELIVGWLIAG
jgi:hypothetical protein